MPFPTRDQDQELARNRGILLQRIKRETDRYARLIENFKRGPTSPLAIQISEILKKQDEFNNSLLGCLAKCVEVLIGDKIYINGDLRPTRFTAVIPIRPGEHNYTIGKCAIVIDRTSSSLQCMREDGSIGGHIGNRIERDFSIAPFSDIEKWVEGLPPMDIYRCVSRIRPSRASRLHSSSILERLSRNPSTLADILTEYVDPRQS